VEFWDRTPLKEQQTIFGRDKHSGAPLGMQHEHDVPDYSRDPDGDMIAWTATFVWRIRVRRRRSPV
jgi:deferrochelatase/peroxidase EfeB